MRPAPSKPFISVIIPTFNRADLLSQSLESLVGQSLPMDQFEVVVIDDGSPDHTAEVCRNFARRLTLRYQRQNNSGISAAKNMGIFISRGPLLLFFDDDDVADADLLKEHIRTHSLHPKETVAVLGHTDWHPSLQISPMMDFVINKGHFLFSYSELKDGQALDFTYFWGGRSSCKKSLLVRHGIFNQLFRFGSEDIELGYRLSKSGLKVIYNRNARSFMIRPLTYDQFCQRCVKQGKSQYHFSKMHPDPVIQKYCMMDDVDRKWAFVRQKLDSKMQRARDLEPAMENILPPAERKRLADELERLYWWTFTALKIKGVVEAKESDTARKDEAHVPEAHYIPPKDLDIIRSRWAKALPRPFQRGNVLIIDPFLPMFDRASGSLRLFEIMKALIRMGYRLTYIARNGEHAGAYVPLLQDMGVEVHAGDPVALQHTGLDIIAPFLDVEKILTSKPFDYVILSFWHVAEYYLPMVRQHCPGSHVIIDTVDIHFLREFREAEMKGDPALLKIARQNKERELAAYRKGDRLWVVTEEDRKAIESLARAPVDVVPNIHEKVSLIKEYDHTSDLLFVGNFNHKPNIDAVLYFHRKIFPLICEQMPDAKVYIVGGNPPEQIRRLQSDRFIVTGYVEDLSPYLNDARISVNPLTYGAGMKGKVGEALSWGLPVVTTSIGAEGMDLQDNENAMIADDPKSFARKVIDLYQDRDLWEKLSRNGKKMVERRWSPRAIQKRIDSSFLDARHFQKGRISVILMASDDRSALDDCLSSISVAVEAPGETVVIGRGSDQSASRHLLQLESIHHGPRSVRAMIEKPATSPVQSWNQALSLCTGSLIVLCRESPDLDIRTLRSIVSCAGQHPEIDILTHRALLLFKARESTDVCTDAQSSHSPACPAVSAPEMMPLPFLIVRSSVVKGIGGFDTGFRDDRLGWRDFIVRSSLLGYRVTALEDEPPAGPGIPYTQTGEAGTFRQDACYFVEKWGIPENAQSPIADIGKTHEEKIAPFELFSSLGEQVPEDSSAHAWAGQPADPQGRPNALASIIILCFNGLTYTRQCLESIEEFTPEPHEIIIVDNGSTDGTPEFLRQYAEVHGNVALIMNECNTGYAAGNNQAIAMAQGDYVVLLNNDVVVTHGWLGRMIGHLEGPGEIGMVGPVTNSISGAQLIPDVPYGTDMNRMHIFAKEIGVSRVGKSEPCMRLVGFCLLISKQVLEIIGGLDEGYKTGNFEDDDLCLRSCIAGYGNVIAQDVFVHHFGSMAFKENSIDHSVTMNANRSYFLEKWKGIVHSCNDHEYRVHLDKRGQTEQLVRWGESAFSEGDILRALKIFERAFRIDPRNTETLNNIGVLQWELGDRDAAVETFQTVLCIEPADADARSNLSDAISAGWKIDSLRPEIKELLEKQPGFSPEASRQAESGDDV